MWTFIFLVAAVFFAIGCLKWKVSTLALIYYAQSVAKYTLVLSLLIPYTLVTGSWCYGTLGKGVIAML